MSAADWEAAASPKNPGMARVVEREYSFIFDSLKGRNRSFEWNLGAMKMPHPALRMVLAASLGVLLVVMASRGVEFERLLELLYQGRPKFLLAALALVLLSPFLRALRWRTLFSDQAPAMTTLVRAIVTGQTLNLLMPLRSGDIARVLMMKDQKWMTAGTIAVEKGIDAAFLAGLCTLLPLVWMVSEWLEGPRVAAILVGSVLLALAVLIVPRLPNMKLQHSAGSLTLLIGISALLWCSGILVNYSVLLFLSLEQPLVVSVALLVILQIGVAVPSTPGKIGVFQELSVLGLSLFGIAKTPALAFGLLVHSLILLPTAAMALAFWVLREKP